MNSDSGGSALQRRGALFELLLAIVAEQVGTSAMKASQGFVHVEPTLLAIFAYLLSLFCFGRSMKVLPMGFAYAIWIGLGMASSSVVSLLVFGEALSVSTLFGLVAIAAGIYVLNSAQEA